MELRGINAIFINQYIEFKRNLGYAFKNTYDLAMFDRFTVENGVNSVGLTRELAEKWREKRLNESEVTRYKRVSEVINFSKYLNHLGYNSFIPNQTRSYRSTFTPYIFSHDKIDLFFTACDSYEVRGTSSMKHIIPIIFRLIYGCGLRANEALSLTNGDVHLDEKYIVIREAKNGCDRILPISDSLAAICDLYRQRYLGGFSKDDYFFCQRNKTRYAADTLYKWFRKSYEKPAFPMAARDWDHGCMIFGILSVSTPLK